MTRHILYMCLGVAVLATAGAACRPPGAGGTRQPPVLTEDPDANLTRQQLAADLATTIREGYAALSGGYEEAYLDGLARDKRLVLIDVGPDDVIVGFPDPEDERNACKFRNQFVDRQPTVVSKRLEVHVSPDGTAGWSFDEISYRVLHEGRRVLIPMRSTGVYERRNGRWLLVQQHVSYGVPDAEIWAYAGEKRAGVPTKLEDWTAPGEPAAEARALLERSLRGDAPWPAAGDLLVVGSDPDVELRGDVAAQASLTALYGGREVRLWDLRVKTSATAQVAWAAANVTIVGEWADKPAELPLRVTWVLTADKGGGWRVAQVHVSAPVPTEELSLRSIGSVIL